MLMPYLLGASECFSICIEFRSVVHLQFDRFLQLLAGSMQFFLFYSSLKAGKMSFAIIEKNLLCDQKNVMVCCLFKLLIVVWGLQIWSGSVHVSFSTLCLQLCESFATHYRRIYICGEEVGFRKFSRNLFRKKIRKIVRLFSASLWIIFSYQRCGLAGTEKFHH